MIDGETVEVVADPDALLLDSSIATKTDTPLLETPRSVSAHGSARRSTTCKSINLIAGQRLHARLVPRGRARTRFRPRLPRRLLRPPPRRPTHLLPGASGSRWPLDRVQYLRGPAAVLYGDGSPGGLVNLVLKKPLPVPRSTGSVGAGERDTGELTADAHGSGDRERAHRALPARGGRRRAWTTVSTTASRGWSVLPMLPSILDARTTLHLDGEYYDQHGRGYRHSVPATPETQRGDFAGRPVGPEHRLARRRLAGLERVGRPAARRAPVGRGHRSTRPAATRASTERSTSRAWPASPPTAGPPCASHYRRAERLEGVPVGHVRDRRVGHRPRRPPDRGGLRGRAQHHGHRDRDRPCTFHRPLRSRVPAASSGAGPAADEQRDRTPGRLPPGPGSPDECPDLRAEPALEPATGGRPSRRSRCRRRARRGGGDLGLLAERGPRVPGPSLDVALWDRRGRLRGPRPRPVSWRVGGRSSPSRAARSRPESRPSCWAGGWV